MTKNIHLLPTDKSSKLYVRNDVTPPFYSNFQGNAVNIYITDDEEIKRGNWVYSEARITFFKVKSICNTSAGYLLIEDDVIMPLEINEVDCKKIILTTDQDLIKDGVQAIDDEFLEWFVNNSSCEKIDVADLWKEGNPSVHDSYQIIIPKEEPKQEPLEEDAERIYQIGLKDDLDLSFHDGVKFGAKWQRERSYNEENLKEAFKSARTVYNYKGEWQEAFSDDMTSSKYESFEKWFEQFKKK